MLFERFYGRSTMQRKTSKAVVGQHHRVDWSEYRRCCENDTRSWCLEKLRIWPQRSMTMRHDDDDDDDHDDGLKGRISRFKSAVYKIVFFFRDSANFNRWRFRGGEKGRLETALYRHWNPQKLHNVLCIAKTGLGISHMWLYIHITMTLVNN